MRLRTNLVVILIMGPWCGTAGTAAAQGYDFPPEQRQNMTARLHVQVANQTETPGLAHVQLTVQVEGSATLEVAPPLLGDSTDAWKPQRLSAWQRTDKAVVWSDTLDLQQVKPGLVPLPSLKVRFREKETANWQEVEWTNIIGDVRDMQLPVATIPPSSFGNWLLWTALVLSGLTFIGAVVFWTRRAKRPQPSLSLEERTLGELAQMETRLSASAFDARMYSWELSALLRRYLAERFALPALRQTTAEFLYTIKDGKIAPEDQRHLGDFLEKCDLIKFAGVAPTIEECRTMAEFVRAFVRETKVVNVP